MQTKELILYLFFGVAFLALAVSAIVYPYTNFELAVLVIAELIYFVYLSFVAISITYKKGKV